MFCIYEKYFFSLSNLLVKLDKTDYLPVIQKQYIIVPSPN